MKRPTVILGSIVTVLILGVLILLLIAPKPEVTILDLKVRYNGEYLESVTYTLRNDGNVAIVAQSTGTFCIGAFGEDDVLAQLGISPPFGLDPSPGTSATCVAKPTFRYQNAEKAKLLVCYLPKREELRFRAYSHIRTWPIIGPCFTRPKVDVLESLSDPIALYPST